VSAAPIVLASRSPQRRAILEQLGLAFRLASPDYDEPPLALPPAELVQVHSRAKARSVEVQPGDGPVLGVDTEVVVDGDVFGKPADEVEAAESLRRLAGREHVVVSGLTLLDGELERTGHAATTVRFRPLTGDEVAGYVAAGEWQGRAGGYAIQGRGAGLVESVEGCFYNVVGLPVALLMRFLLGLDAPVGRAG
jgi:septum formation protein